MGESQNAYEMKFEVTNEVKYRPSDFLQQVQYFSNFYGLLWEN
jgi:hypothetical protein